MNYRLQHKLKIANEFEAQGKYLHAVQIYQSLINEYPQYTEAYISLADLYNLLGNKKSAKKIFKDIIKIQPENLEVKIYFAEFLIKNEEWQESIDILSKYSSENDPFISYLIGYAYFNLEEYEFAKIHLLKFVITDEKPELIYNAYFLIAKSDFQLKNYNSSLKFAKKADDFYYDNPEMKLLFAQIYYCLGMFTHGVDSISKALKLNPDDSEINRWAGKLFLKTGDVLKATQYFSKFIELKKDITSGDFICLADECLKSGKFNEALNYYRSAEQLDPANLKAIEGKEKVINLINNMVSDA